MSGTLATGLGFDAHRFASDPRPLYLATLEWDGTGIEGDSDGDVAVHALVDAYCSAAGLGDIGTVFGVGPDSLGAGMHGDAMLRHVMDLLAARGCAPASASVVVVGNRPKIGPRRAEAQEALCAILGCPVSLTATTTDGMGFTGRGEGLAAMATVLMRLP
ncbi:MAG: 2-C-methyl-D-erythritol 2,4-cyclodiphosphate synthase [Bifidobacterium sp.]|nr:2-C-methyl-D-erythritol 2,4-cyclodiphosphate synthase [Bifidobacterium sp.]